MTGERLAAVVLARAIADAINPERSADSAVLGNALLTPLTGRVIELLAQQGYVIEQVEPDRSAA